MATTTRRTRREAARLPLRGILEDAMGERGRRRANQFLYTLPFPIGAGNMAAAGGTIKAESRRAGVGRRPQVLPEHPRACRAGTIARRMRSASDQYMKTP